MQENDITRDDSAEAVDAVALTVFASRIASVCDEMGAVLRRTAFSPNIRDRLDFSCAVFDTAGRLTAQAAHIPVHLGSMAYAMAGVVGGIQPEEGDVWVFNDPFLGGTHLPDVTLVAPVFVEGRLMGYVANRAHHADIGAVTPGSMPLSTRLEGEGVVIPPRRLYAGGVRRGEVLEAITSATRNPRQAAGDFAAQASSVRAGAVRLAELIGRIGPVDYPRAVASLNRYAERLVRDVVAAIPDGRYRFSDWMDDDGQGRRDLEIRVTVEVAGDEAVADFTGTSPQTGGNINCPLPVAAAAVYYVFRCLMPEQTPPCAGAFAPVLIVAPEGCLVNARRPAAVAAGNVETSQRIVDAVCGALAQALPGRVPAASHGSMNNLAMGGGSGDEAWDYYETMAGGAGGGPHGPGRSAIHTHMTNTLNTPLEALEMVYPLRIRRYAVRRGSGGAGRHRGGDGVVREYELLAPAEATLITERRRHPPWGLAGGAAGAAGENRLNGELLPGKAQCRLGPGDRLEIATPGGGGWGR